jgi:uncharacterized protein YraI
MRLSIRTALLALLLCLPLPVFAVDGYVSADVNLRTGPGTEYPPVTLVPQWTGLQVQGCVEGYSWCDVVVGADRGWIYAQYLEYVQGGEPAYIYDNGPRLGIPIIVFSLGTYWDTYYFSRPWYRYRGNWINHRPIYRPLPPPSMRPPPRPPIVRPPINRPPINRPPPRPRPPITTPPPRPGPPTGPGPGGRPLPNPGNGGNRPGPNPGNRGNRPGPNPGNGGNRPGPNPGNGGNPPGPNPGNGGNRPGPGDSNNARPQPPPRQPAPQPQTRPAPQNNTQNGNQNGG